ncbi:MAG: HlyD family efflux transporter periplasmic adaptor subunit, partial [Planctomycetaceae bacterium]|nr:HlyD family efflux transporter periplasmic adaptor subunit [Planctomycetaceae bacterium]
LVESGMIVAHLKDDVAQAQHNIHLKEASNTVDKRYALKASEVAKVKYERALNVNQKIKGTYPEIELREYKLDAERATLQIEQAEHQQAVAELTAQESAVQLKTFDLKAPFSGTIIKVYKSKGEAVNQGDPVVELLNIDTVRVNSWINRDIAHQIKRGEKVLVKLLIDEKDNEFPGSDQILEGKVQYIDLKTGGSSRKRVKIGVDVQNQDHLLLPGSAVALKIVR